MTSKIVHFLKLRREQKKREEKQFLERLKEGYYKHRPFDFVIDCFPWGNGQLRDKTGPRVWQREILIEIGDKLERGVVTLEQVIREAIASGHGIGKSALVSWLILWGISSFEDAKGVVTANTETQLKTKTWAEVSKWYYLSKLQKMFELTATAFFHREPKHRKNWRMDMVPWSEKNTEAFAGLHNEGKRILVIFDEASKIHDQIWEVTEGALTDEKTEIIWAVFGNPTRNVGKFRECFRKFKHRWKNRQIDSREVEGTNKTQLNEWITDYGENSDFVKIRVRGLFPSSSAKQFISTALVDAAYGKKLEEKQYSFAPKILTLDPAWEGDDELVFGFRQGLIFRVLETLEKNDDDVFIANKLARYEDELEIDGVIIDKGYGTGIFSAGKAMGRNNWLLCDFGGKSPDIGCFNMRGYIWDQTKKWLVEGGAIEKDQTLYDELISMETKSRLDGKVQMLSKADMKKLGLTSPNRGDALAMSFAFPIRKKVKKQNSVNAHVGGWMG